MNTDDSEINSRLQKIFQDVLKVSDFALEPSLELWRVPGWDSISRMRIILRVESAFQIRFRPEDVLALKAVEDIMSLIRQRVDRREA